MTKFAIKVVRQTYRRQASASAASVRLQTGRDRANATQGLSVGKAIRVPGLRARQIIGIGVVLQGRVQTLEAGGFVAGHLVLVEIDGHGTVCVELARGLAVEGLLMPLGARGSCRGIVIHVRLLITHGWGRRWTLGFLGRNVGEKSTTTHTRWVGTGARRTWRRGGNPRVGTTGEGEKQAKSLTDAKSCRDS